MAHKALVGGTAYEIKGGRCLVDGTGYGIQKGRTLVGGTGYDIKFGPDTIPVTITGSGYEGRASAKINGVEYYEATSGIEVEPGSAIRLYIRGRSSSVKGYVYINGSQVMSTGTVATYYEWTVPQDCNAITITLKYGSSEVYVRVTTT